MQMIEHHIGAVKSEGREGNPDFLSLVLIRRFLTDTLTVLYV